MSTEQKDDMFDMDNLDALDAVERRCGRRRF